MYLHPVPLGLDDLVIFDDKDPEELGYSCLALSDFKVFEDKLEAFLLNLRMQGWVLPPFKLPEAFYRRGSKLVVECSRLLRFQPEIWRQTLNCIRKLTSVTTTKLACEHVQKAYKQLV